MGRKRKDGDPLGLAGTRLTMRHGAFYYRHRDGRWQHVGTDVKAAKERAALFNDPDGIYGTLRYWLGRFLLDCEARVAAKTLSERTLADYRDNVEWLKPVFGHMAPEQLRPSDVAGFLAEGERLGRGTRANRERACLSACMSWLIREGHTSAIVNPCMRASGVTRNAETKRERYVTHEEFRETAARAPASVQLMMHLVYRTLQRPESDILGWTGAIVVRKGAERVLLCKQGKTGVVVDIEITPELDTLLKRAIGKVPVLHQTLVHDRDGKPYTYSGLSSMLKRAQAAARAAGKSVGSFGFRDLKGKGATDMWLAGVPIEQIQLLCGHRSARTTEIYIKQRWRETARPNAVQLIG